MGEPAGVLLPAAILFLLVSGCASLYGPQKTGIGERVLDTHGIPFPNQTIVNHGTPNATKNWTQPVYEGKPDRGCNLTVTPGAIYAGDTAEVSFSLYARADTDFAYVCGDEEQHITTMGGGFLTGIRMCQFNKPGTILVWMKAENETCAGQNLTVKPRISDPRNCFIDGIEYLPNYTYNATVHYDGFTESDDFVWFCDSSAFRKQVRPGSQQPWATNISCEFGSKPHKDEIEVFIGAIKCGGIPTAQP